MIVEPRHTAVIVEPRHTAVIVEPLSRTTIEVTS